ncbi:MAG: peptide deformylase [Phycisphaerae bacterium]
MQNEELSIVHYPDPVLKKNCQTVTEFGDDLKALVEQMYKLMHAARGIGLAAPQVGLPLRIFVYNISGEDADNQVCINPELIDLEGAATDDEGCLSLPGITVNVKRATQLTMRGQDTDGNPVELKGTDLLARVWQHENDHLHGKLIIDNMSPSDEIANRKAVKKLEDEFKPRNRRR